MPDVLVEDVENKKLWLQRVIQEKKDGVLSSVFYLAPIYEGVLQHDPFSGLCSQREGAFNFI